MSTSLQEIIEWLIRTGSRQETLLDLTGELVQRVSDAGIPLSRLNLGVFALHPEMAGYAVFWDLSMAAPVEAPIRHEDTLLPIYLASPIRQIVETRVPIAFDLEDLEQCREYAVLREFRAQGHTDYRGFPVGYGEGGVAVLTLCTNRAGGFRDDEVEALCSLFPVLRLLIELVETRRLAKTLVRTYLGRSTGDRVLNGEILRGQGELIQAALWVCDLVGFTSLTESIGSVAMIEVMNQYFDCMAQAVWEEGGEILKFMGDGLLVVFRITGEVTAGEAARRGVRAVQRAQVRLRALSVERAAGGLSHLRAAFAVHLGEVVYGNVGAKTRLDFTVMGGSVNLAARLQRLCGELGESMLISAQVAEHLDESLASMGSHHLKGVSEPVEVFRVV